MTTARVIGIGIVAGFVAGLVGGVVGAQVASAYLGPQVHAGLDAPAVTAAQIQAIGTDGGIGLITTTTTGESYLLGMQPFYDGGPLRKDWSLSGLVLNHDPQSGYAGVRVNADYRVNGVTYDNILQVWCGGHGVVINPVDPWARGECPGPNGTRIHGTLYVDHLVVGGVPWY